MATYRFQDSYLKRRPLAQKNKALPARQNMRHQDHCKRAHQVLSTRVHQVRRRRVHQARCSDHLPVRCIEVRLSLHSMLRQDHRMQLPRVLYMQAHQVQNNKALRGRHILCNYKYRLRMMRYQHLRT